MTSLVADYGTSSGSENEKDVRSDDDDDDDGDGGDDDDNNDNISKDEEEDPSNDDGKEETVREETLFEEDESKTPLPKPNFASAPQPKTSVFTNPFVEAEKAKSAILEKHVKMTPTLDDTKMINGRKICWNYRKGRCRFGHNCTFAHDSDLHRSAAELEASRAPEETIICQTHYAGQTKTSVVNGRGGGDDDDDDEDDDDDDDHHHHHHHHHHHRHHDHNDDEEQEIDQENNQLQKRKKRPGLAQNLVPGKKVLKLYKAQQAKTIGR